MNHLIHRESLGMKQFSSESCNIASELEDICAHLRQVVCNARSYIQDQSGMEAISVVEELLKDTTVAVGTIHVLANQIEKSAILIEESDTLL